MNNGMLDLKPALTQDRLKSMLNYDPETGIFTWLASRGKVRAGTAAGFVRGQGYIRISVDKRDYYAHRLAFLWTTGLLPKYEVDHINGIRSDNRWENLRDVPAAVNKKNQKMPCRNTSGVMGVSWRKAKGKWCAQIPNGERTHIGYFDNIIDAANARKAAERKLGYHPNHGRSV